jgi:hypothetical protein
MLAANDECLPKTGFTAPHWRRRFRVVSFTFRETVTRASKKHARAVDCRHVENRNCGSYGPRGTSGEAARETQVILGSG